MEPLVLAFIFLRVIIPLAILRWPLPGAFASLLIDALDYPVFSHTVGVPSYYVVYDKVLDTYYLTVELIVSFRWAVIPKVTSAALYIYRLAGVILFMITRATSFFFYFPNVFEWFFILELLRARYFSRFAWNWKRLVTAVILLALIKTPTEYAQHVNYVDSLSWLKETALSVFRKI